MTTYLTTEQAVELAQQHGAALDVLALGRHDGVLMTPMELGKAMNAAIAAYLNSLAEGLPEPVAWMRPSITENGIVYDSTFRDETSAVKHKTREEQGFQKLYSRDQLLACIAKAKGEIEKRKIRSCLMPTLL